MNKPVGVLCSREDYENRRTLFDLLSDDDDPSIFMQAVWIKILSGLILHQ